MARIAVDAMGGDHAPDEVVRGAAQVSMETDHHLLLVGEPARIEAILASAPHNSRRIEIIPAAQSISMEEDPKAAVEGKPDASINVAVRIVKEGQADVLVSAGSTGAGILACAKRFSRAPGVSRAALASVYPTEIRRGEKDDPFSLILDVGATVNVTGRDLVSFAVMGSVYASIISRNARPKVALLSNGTEELKGLPEIKEAHQTLKNGHLINFTGNIEGVDIPRGTADVVVCGGFHGNLVVKMLEGIGEAAMRLAFYAYKKHILWKLGLLALRSGIKQLKQITDWEQYGGAPLIGFDHLMIKAHGRSRALAVKNAIKVAGKTVHGRLIEKIATGMAEFGELGS
ncbi:MAG: phosphate acyltransferase PlsX [Nitrospirae bacterium]|nr:phosphate acyltransferase PlsX [Nitrospirota bacterium]